MSYLQHVHYLHVAPRTPETQGISDNHHTIGGGYAFRAASVGKEYPCTLFQDLICKQTIAALLELAAIKEAA